MTQAERAAEESRGYVTQSSARPFVDVYRSRYDELVRVARLTTGSLELAEELVQDAFADLYRRYDTVRRPDAYVQRAVMGRCTSWVRRRVIERRHVERRHLDGRLPEPEWSNDPDTLAVVDALGRLPVRQRAVVVLRYLADWSEVEAAEALGLRPAAARSLLARARARLAQELSGTEL